MSYKLDQFFENEGIRYLNRCMDIMKEDYESAGRIRKRLWRIAILQNKKRIEKQYTDNRVLQAELKSTQSSTKKILSEVHKQRQTNNKNKAEKTGLLDRIFTFRKEHEEMQITLTGLGTLMQGAALSIEAELLGISMKDNKELAELGIVSIKPSWWFMRRANYEKIKKLLASAPYYGITRCHQLEAIRSRL